MTNWSVLTSPLAVFLVVVAAVVMEVDAEVTLEECQRDCNPDDSHCVLFPGSIGFGCVEYSNVGEDCNDEYKTKFCYPQVFDNHMLICNGNDRCQVSPTTKCGEKDCPTLNSKCMGDGEEKICKEYALARQACSAEKPCFDGLECLEEFKQCAPKEEPANAEEVNRGKGKGKGNGNRKSFPPLLQKLISALKSAKANYQNSY